MLMVQYMLFLLMLLLAWLLLETTGKFPFPMTCFDVELGSLVLLKCFCYLIASTKLYSFV